MSMTIYHILQIKAKKNTDPIFDLQNIQFQKTEIRLFM